MGTPFFKRNVSALAPLFLAATLGLSLGAPDALAATGKTKPKNPPPRTLKTDNPATLPPLECAQKASTATADKHGYLSKSGITRISALAHLRETQGKDASPITAIALASAAVGIDFDLMVMKAVIESRLGQYDEPLLGGSARGLFHFMPATWLTLFSWFGAEFNNGFYADAAAQIKFDELKNPYTDDPDLKEKILALRSDPYVAAFIKAKEVRQDEQPLLRAVLGRNPTYTDFYVAHFLGLDRAKTFFRALRKNPKTPAASVFVKESEDPNNRPLFYKGKRQLSVREVYNKLDRVVSNVLGKTDAMIAKETKDNKCIPPLALHYPDRERIIVTIRAIDPGSPPPEKPGDNIPMDPDAIIHPVPEPGTEPKKEEANHLALSP